MDYQLVPRLLAIAERGWSAKDTVDWADLSGRLSYHVATLDQLGVRYNKMDVSPGTTPVVPPAK